MRCRMPTFGSTMAAPRQGTSSVSGRRCSRCSLIVRRLQGLLSSEPGDELRAPSGIWLSRDPGGAFYQQPDSATALSAWMPDVRTATDSGTEVRMIEDRGADSQLLLGQYREPNALLCAPRTRIAVVRVAVRTAVHVRDAAHKATMQRDDGWRHLAVPVGRRASAGPVSGGYAPYLSWWRSQLISGPSLRPGGCSQSS